MNVLDLLLNTKDSQEEEEENIKRACMWLNETGFPQYLQMYNDGEFPISLKLIQEDHSDFDGDTLMALFRRIEILNKSAEAKQKSNSTDNHSDESNSSYLCRPKPRYEIIEDDEDDSEDEEDDDKENVLQQTALSLNWSYEPRTRRWSHIDIKPIAVDNCHVLEKYLGTAYPRPFSSPQIPSKRDSNNSPYVNHNNRYKFETIVETGDPLFDEDHRNLMNSNLLSVTQDADSPDIRNRTDHIRHTDDNNKTKQNPHILRSTSLKLSKTVPIFNRNQLSFRHSKRPQDNISAIKIRDELPSKDVSEHSDQRDVSPLKFHSLTIKTPQQMTNLTNDFYSVGDTGWINYRTGSFMSRKSRQIDSDQKPKTQTVPSDLDQLVNILKSDVRSLDLMRSKITSKSSPDSAPNSPVLRTKDRNSKDKSLQRLSDFESYTYSKRITHIQLPEDVGNNRVSFPGVIDEGVCDGTDVEAPAPTKFNRNMKSRWSHSVHSKSKSSIHHYHLAELSVSQVNILKKLAILGCTTLLDKHCPSQKNIFSWRLPRLLSQKPKVSTEGSYSTFGVSLSVFQKRFGNPYPPAIMRVFDYVREHGPVTQGIFRKTGMKSRIRQMKKEIEENEDFNSFDDYNVNDIADVLKGFFRDLPDRLFTSKVSTTLLAIYNYVPQESRFEGLRLALFSLPDENRIALDVLLDLFSYLSKFSDFTKMDIKNISLCFAPSLFNFQNDGSSVSPMSPLRIKRTGPNAKHLAEQNAAHLCLVDMITNFGNLFKVNDDIFKKTLTIGDKSEPKDITRIISTNSWSDWIGEKIDQMKSDVNTHKSGWTNISKDVIKKFHGPNLAVEQLSYRKIGSHHNYDVVALRTWKVLVDIEAPPENVFLNIKDKRCSWDADVLTFETLEEMTEYVDLVKMVSSNMDGSTIPRCFYMLRGHQWGLHCSSHVIVSESVSCDNIVNTTEHVSSSKPSSNWNCVISGQVFCDNFVVEAISTKITRVTWVSRVDLKGHHSDWYSSHWGHSMIRKITKLKTFSEAEFIHLAPLSSNHNSHKVADSERSYSRDHSTNETISQKVIDNATETVL